jgi:hypothetical protein
MPQKLQALLPGVLELGATASALCGLDSICCVCRVVRNMLPRLVTVEVRESIVAAIGSSAFGLEYVSEVCRSCAGSLDVMHANTKHAASNIVESW